MLFDFMQQVMSRLDTIQKKVEVTQQNLDKLVRKMDKKKGMCKWSNPFNNI